MSIQPCRPAARLGGRSTNGIQNCACQAKIQAFDSRWRPCALYAGRPLYGCFDESLLRCCAPYARLKLRARLAVGYPKAQPIIVYQTILSYLRGGRNALEGIIMMAATSATWRPRYPRARQAPDSVMPIASLYSVTRFQVRVAKHVQVELGEIVVSVSHS